MDAFERASKLEAQSRAIAIAARREAGPPATGHCAFCGEPVADGLRWCDTDCRDDWQRALHARRQRCA